MRLSPWPRRPKITRVSELDELIVKDAKAVRAVYLGPETEEIEVTLLFEGGSEARLRFAPNAAGKLCTQLVVAYEAIRPTLHSGFGRAGWQGMRND